MISGKDGFEGPPDGSGSGKIGCTLVPGYRGRELATEATGGLAGGAFPPPEFEALPHGHGSIRVLEKLSTRFTGALDGKCLRRLDRTNLTEGGTL